MNHQFSHPPEVEPVSHCPFREGFLEFQRKRVACGESRLIPIREIRQGICLVSERSGQAFFQIRPNLSKLALNFLAFLFEDFEEPPSRASTSEILAFPNEGNLPLRIVGLVTQDRIPSRGASTS